MIIKDSCRSLFDLLVKQKLTFATAESLTGGMIAERFTSFPGSSAVFWGGVVSYMPQAKIAALHVCPETIQKNTVVSGEVALEMLKGILALSGADTAVAVTGVAGPGGGSERIPVGSVWIAAGNRDRAVTRLFHFDGTRDEIRLQTVEAACRLLCSVITDEK